MKSRSRDVQRVVDALLAHTGVRAADRVDAVLSPKML